MQVALAYHSGDMDQAQRWSDWTAELGGTDRHTLLVMAAKGCPPIRIDTTKWAQVLPCQDSYGVTSNWNANDPIRDASGPNSMIRQFAWVFVERKKGPWFFCEPDTVPLRTSWLDELEAEYAKSGKPYMAAVIPGVEGQYGTHPTGNMILPQDAAFNEGLMLPSHAHFGGRTIEIAFDVACATKVLPFCHETRLIQQIFRGETFSTASDLNRIRPDACLFHNSKDGSLINLLRTQRSGGSLVVSGPPEQPVPTSIPQVIFSLAKDLSKAMKPVVHTYFAPSSDEATRKEQEAVLELWKKNWTEHGWDARVLTEDVARRHLQFKPYQEAIEMLPIKNPMEYEKACFNRWLAMAVNGGGIMVDMDVLCRDAKEVPRIEDKIMLNCGHVPCAVVGTAAHYESMFLQFLLTQSPSDMDFFDKRPDKYEHSVGCVEYGKPGWKDASLIHFGHFACAPRKRSEAMRDWMEPKEYTVKTGEAVCEFTKLMPIFPKDVVFPGQFTVKELIEGLSFHASKDGFAKGRVIKQLRKAGLFPNKK